MAALVGVTPSPRSGQALSRSEGACPERSEGSPRRQPRQRRCFAAAQHDRTRQFQLDSPLELPGGGLSFRRVAPPVLWVLGSFTAVFGKGTGGATPLEPPGS